MAHKNKNTRHPAVDPPFKHQSRHTKLTPSEAQSSLAKFLQKTASKPHLHPDSFLSNTGIRFAIGSGPRGGIALHHLRRIDAGLRGEVLQHETAEQLEALFGPQAGDDAALDGQIARSEARLRNAKKRKREAIEEWVDSSSQVEEDEVNDVLKGYTTHHHEIESFAATPVHRPDYGGVGEGQDPYEYDLQQRVWTKDPRSGEGGAVGRMVRQDGAVPQIVEEDGVVSKAERKKAKQLRKEERRMEMARANEKQRAGKAVEEERVEDVDAKRAKEARRAEKKARKEAEEKPNGVKEGSEDEDERARAKAEKKARKKDEKKEPLRREADGVQQESHDEDERERLRAEKKKRKKEKKARSEKEGS